MSRKGLFESLYKENYRQCCLFSLSYVHDRVVAEDIASESIIRVWEVLKEEPDWEGDARPLLMTIVKNKSLDYLKHSLVRDRVTENLSDWHQRDLMFRIATLEVCDPQEIFTEDIQSIVHRELGQMSEQTRQIFHLSRFENLSAKEIAQHMELSVKAIEYHLTKCLKHLRVALREYLPFFILWW